MQWNKSTRYALYAMIEMASIKTDELVTVATVAAKYGISQTALAKVLQQLVRAGLAIGVRGVNGGYRLSRTPREITVLDVVTVFEAPVRPDGHCLLGAIGDEACQLNASCRLRQLFDEVEQQVHSTFASVTLETLTGTSPPATV